VKPPAGHRVHGKLVPFCHALRAAAGLWREAALGALRAVRSIPSRLIEWGAARKMRDRTRRRAKSGCAAKANSP